MVDVLGLVSDVMWEGEGWLGGKVSFVVRDASRRFTWKLT